VKRILGRSLVPALAVLLLLVPHDAEAQLQGSLGAGYAFPVGDFGDLHDNGFTVRGQLGLSFLLASVHGQVGWTRFPGADLENLLPEDVDFFHAGVGGRVGLGLFWVGLTGAYFSGDGEDGMGFLPEVGVGLGPLEAVADSRIDGDEKWIGVRVNLKF
jgi:hypothetical protein